MQTSKANHAHIQGGKLLAELFRLGIGEARSWAFLASEILQGGLAGATLCGHILVVILCSASKEMSWIDAGRIVALVQAIQTIGDWAIVQFVRDTMRSLGAAIHAKLTVAVYFASALPFPTIIGAAPIYFFPKAICNRASRSNLVVMSEDEPNGLSFDVTLSADIGFRYGSRMAAATFAKLSGIVRGIMGLHKKLAFLVPSLGTFRDVAGALSIGFYRSNCTTKCVLLKVIGGTMVSFVAVSESPDRQ